MDTDSESKARAVVSTQITQHAHSLLPFDSPPTLSLLFPGAKALYLSGSGVATSSFGLPDLGITTADNVVEDVKRLTGASALPLLVDIDTGFGSAFNIARTVRDIEKAGAAAVHIEDQEQAKRCGHRPVSQHTSHRTQDLEGISLCADSCFSVFCACLARCLCPALAPQNKQIVSLEEMVDRIKAAVSGRTDPEFVIMARTDALANEGLEKAIARAKAYIDAGADMLFPEACTKLEDYRAFQSALSLPNYHKDVPILANITEFGQTPLYTVEELGSAGVSMVLYPLSAFRAMVSCSALQEHCESNGAGLHESVHVCCAPCAHRSLIDALCCWV